MIVTDMTGKTCVGELRLSALDVGASLLAQGIPVEIPDECRSCGYDDADGRTWLIEGTPDEIRETLTKAGYAVEKNR